MTQKRFYTSLRPHCCTSNSTKSALTDSSSCSIPLLLHHFLNASPPHSLIVQNNNRRTTKHHFHTNSTFSSKISSPLLQALSHRYCTTTTNTRHSSKKSLHCPPVTASAVNSLLSHSQRRIFSNSFSPHYDASSSADDTNHSAAANVPSPSTQNEPPATVLHYRVNGLKKSHATSNLTEEEFLHSPSLHHQNADEEHDTEEPFLPHDDEQPAADDSPSQEAVQKFKELSSLLQKRLYLEFLKELFDLHVMHLELSLSAVQRRQLYTTFLEQIDDQSLISLLTYRTDLFLQNQTLLYFLLTFIWREKRRDLRDAFFTNEVEQYFLYNRVCHLLRRGNEPIDEVLRHRLIRGYNTKDPEPESLLNFLEQIEKSPSPDEESSRAFYANPPPALIEHSRFEMKLIHQLTLFYLDNAQYETAYNIMRINCTPIDTSSPYHKKAWTHFYANTVRFAFMSSNTRKVGYRFRKDKTEPLSTNDRRAITKIISQPISHQNISLNALVDYIYYHVVLMEFCGLSKDVDLATTFFVEYTVPHLQELNSQLQSLPYAVEDRLIGGFFRCLYYSQNAYRLIEIFEKLFEDESAQPCKLHQGAWHYVLLAYANEGDYKKFKELLRRVQSEVHNFNPHAIMYGILNGFLDQKNTKAVYNLFQEMYVGRTSIAPSARVVTVLIEALLHDDKLSHAVKVFEQYFGNSVEVRVGELTHRKSSVVPLHPRPVALLVRAMFEKDQPEMVFEFLRPLKSVSVEEWKKTTDVAPILAALISNLEQFSQHDEQIQSFVAIFKEIQTQQRLKKQRD